MSDNILVVTVKSQKASGEKIFRMHKRRAVIGSASSSDLKLEDASVSPVHAIVELSGVDGKPVIYDLASETGLVINSTPQVQATLAATDQIQIGPYLLQIKVQPLSEAQKTPERVAESFGQKLFVSDKEDLAPLLLEDSANVIDIFDHTPEAKTSLQVVMFFGETIMDVEHFVDRKRVVIGPRGKEDFSIPPFLGEGKSGRFELVTGQSGQYQLHLHDQMQGVVHSSGKLESIKTLGTKAVNLGEKDFAKVKLGDVSFFMSYTAAPPRLKFPKLTERDPLFLRIWLTSLAVTGLLLLALTSMKVNPAIEIEQLPERVATIIYEPKNLPVEKPVVKEPEKKPEPVVAKVPEPKVIKITPKAVTTPEKKNAMIGDKPDQDQKKQQAKSATPKATSKSKLAVAHKASGQEGAGVKAKGDEGLRGKQNATRKDTPQIQAKRPGEGKPTNGAATNRGHSQTNDMGVVDVFKSNQGTLSKILAGGKGASNAADKLEGYSGFTTRGSGLGAAGAGSGGGGQSQGLGGLSDHGVGGGKKGTGLGALGSGGNILGGKGKYPIDSSGGGSLEPIVLGSIDTDAIAREINKHKDEIKYCYEKEINAENPDLAGRVGIRFVIGASGSVTAVGVNSTTLKNANTEKCVCEVIKRIQFPPVRGGGVAEVTYPFVFKPSNR